MRSETIWKIFKRVEQIKISIALDEKTNACMDGEVVLTGRVDFRGGGTLDGALLAQTLFRLRTAEGEIAELKAIVSPLVFINYTAGMSVSLAITGVLVFQPGTTAIVSVDFNSAPAGTIYRFGNATTEDVTVGTSSGPLLTLVPGEYSRLVKLTSGWLPLFAI